MLVGVPLCNPSYAGPSSTAVTVGVVLMCVCELVNLAVHVQLRMMRPREGSTRRDPPTGPLFAFVTSPNYTAEVLGWLAFSIMTALPTAYIFTVIGFLQMKVWASDKYRNYKKSHPQYAASRTPIVPFLL